MPRFNDADTTRIHLHIYSADIEFLDAHFGPNIGRSKAAREIIHKFIEGMKAKIKARSVSGGQVAEDLISELTPQ